MNIDVNALNPKELAELISSATAAQKAVESKHREQTRAELADLSKAAGYDIYELFGFGKASKPGRPRKSDGSKSSTGLVAKYASPSGETWVGRGKRPRWVNDHVSNGGKLEDLLIAKVA